MIVSRISLLHSCPMDKTNREREMEWKSAECTHEREEKLDAARTSDDKCVNPPRRGFRTHYRRSSLPGARFEFGGEEEREKERGRRGEIRRTIFDHLSIARGRPCERPLPRQRHHLNVIARARLLKGGALSWASVLDEPLRTVHGRLLFVSHTRGVGSRQAFGTGDLVRDRW
jgi:hypothetical protein